MASLMLWRGLAARLLVLGAGLALVLAAPAGATPPQRLAQATFPHYVPRSITDTPDPIPWGNTTGGTATAQNSGGTPPTGWTGRPPLNDPPTWGPGKTGGMAPLVPGNKAGAAPSMSLPTTSSTPAGATSEFKCVVIYKTGLADLAPLLPDYDLPRLRDFVFDLRGVVTDLFGAVYETGIALPEMYKVMGANKYEATAPFTIQTDIRIPGGVRSHCAKLAGLNLDENGGLTIPPGFRWNGTTDFFDIRGMDRASMVHDALLVLSYDGIAGKEEDINRGTGPNDCSTQDAQNYDNREDYKGNRELYGRRKGIDRELQKAATADLGARVGDAVYAVVRKKGPDHDDSGEVEYSRKYHPDQDKPRLRDEIADVLKATLSLPEYLERKDTLPHCDPQQPTADGPTNMGGSHIQATTPQLPSNFLPPATSQTPAVGSAPPTPASGSANPGQPGFNNFSPGTGGGSSGSPLSGAPPGSPFVRTTATDVVETEAKCGPGGSVASTPTGRTSEQSASAYAFGCDASVSGSLRQDKVEIGGITATSSFGNAEAGAGFKVASTDALAAVGARAGVSAWSGELSNGATKAELAVLTGEIEATANISKNLSSAELSAGAEAYLVKGEVTHEFNILGLHFAIAGDAGIGAAADATAKYDLKKGTAKFEFSGGLGVILGGSLDISLRKDEPQNATSTTSPAFRAPRRRRHRHNQVRQRPGRPFQQRVRPLFVHGRPAWPHGGTPRPRILGSG